MAHFFLASPVFADGFSIEKAYSFHQQDHVQKDAACVSAFADNITPEFRGLTGLQLMAPTIVGTSLGALATYPNVTFLSSYGDAQGTISCVFSKTHKTPTDISVSFVGSGLGGFEKRGRIASSSDPADWKVTSFSSQVNP